MVHSDHKAIPNKPIEPVTKFLPALKLKYFSPSSQKLLHRVLPLARLTQFTFSLILLTYLLTPWIRVLLEKLTGSAASQEIPRIFGTRRFLTVFTSARHLSISRAKLLGMPVRTGVPSSHSHRLIIPDDVLIQFDLLMKSTVMLETCRDMK